jgi:hypothetical protein
VLTEDAGRNDYYAHWKQVRNEGGETGRNTEFDSSRDPGEITSRREHPDDRLPDQYGQRRTPNLASDEGKKTDRKRYESP